jgi:hypothetical protein
LFVLGLQRAIVSSQGPVMGEVELPFVAATTEIESALQVMRGSDRSGIVTETQHRPVVLTDEDLISTLRYFGNVPIAKVTPGHRTLVALPGTSLHSAFSNLNDREQIFNMMNMEAAHFTIGTSAAGRLEVVTIAESLSAMLGRRQILCRCQTNPRHVWRKDQLAHENKCNSDGDPVVCS